MVKYSHGCFISLLIIAFNLDAMSWDNLIRTNEYAYLFLTFHKY